ncbi:hypothetical protein DICVIV_04345 [Dictyocaulus viviparus]|uniref:Uncharacterized protein n=1 Tax=Dictyocaulus viviparus TaxID=29172 RepID=A0A0D8Y4L8_DICVI|nr:hypothetical protein DICVIV_04345 [Dictyocaulus viviparus]
MVTHQMSGCVQWKRQEAAVIANDFRFTEWFTPVSSYDIWKIGWVLKYSGWVPHEFGRKTLDGQVAIYTSLFAANKIKPFLDWMITRDGRSNYENVVRERPLLKSGKPSSVSSEPSWTHNARIL